MSSESPARTQRPRPPPNTKMKMKINNTKTQTTGGRSGAMIAMLAFKMLPIPAYNAKPVDRLTGKPQSYVQFANADGFTYRMSRTDDRGESAYILQNVHEMRDRTTMTAERAQEHMNKLSGRGITEVTMSAGLDFTRRRGGGDDDECVLYRCVGCVADARKRVPHVHFQDGGGGVVHT
jgi:hypothetical protein